MLAGQGIDADKAHPSGTLPSVGSFVGTRRHAVVLCEDGINVRKAVEQGFHLLARLPAQPGTLAGCQQAYAGVIGDAFQKTFVPLDGRGGTSKSGNLHHNAAALQQRADVSGYFTAYGAVVGTDVGGVSVGRDFAVHQYHGDAFAVGFLHHRSDGLGFVGRHHQQVHPFVDKIADVLFLPGVIVFGGAHLHLHIVIKTGFAGNLAVHLPPPLVVATLGDTDAVTGGGAGAGGKHDTPQAQKQNETGLPNIPVFIEHQRAYHNKFIADNSFVKD